MSKAKVEQKIEATVDQPVTDKKEDILTQEDEETEQLDEADQKALNNANNIDFDAFSKQPNDKISKKASNSKKAKANKGQDFQEYAQKNGINYNIQYEEKDLKDKKYAQAKHQHNTQNNYNNNTNNNPQNKTYNNENNQINNNFKKVKKGKRKMNPNVSPKQQGVNKFDSFNYNMMFNPYMYMNMTRPDLLKAHSYQNAEHDFQKLSLDEENNNNNDKNIVDALNYYFSIENLNKDYFIRSKLNEEGYLEAEEIINFHKMKKNAVTIEKIQNLLEQNKTTIEAKVENEKLYLRNINWDTISEKLIPLEDIQMKKNPKKYQYNVHMQNNLYYNFSPQMMQPHNMPVDPYFAQQMAYYQMNMLGNYPQHQPFQPYNATQQFQQNDEINN